MEVKTQYVADIIEEDIDPEISTQDLPNFRINRSEFEEIINKTTVVDESDPINPTIKNFIFYFHQQIKNRSIDSIRTIYETDWGRMSEKYYKSTPWPQASAISSLVNNDEVFLILYKEMAYRHIHTRISNTPLEHRIESWKNYVELFNYLLNGTDVKLELPVQWLWDMIDEFVYQFQSFCQIRNKLKTPEDIQLLKNNPQTWSVSEVLNIHQALITKSSILTVLEREKQGQTEEQAIKDLKYGSNPLYRMLGFFCIVGQMRVQCLMGDFHLVLKTISSVDILSRTRSSQVTSCHVTLYYHLGFACMMLRRFIDAIKTFSNILVYINRTRQFHTKSSQYDSIMKKNDQIYSLLAICVSVCAPQRVDDNVYTMLKDKYADKISKMQKGEDQAFEELFMYGSPKFINPTFPNYTSTTDEPATSGQESLRLCFRLFLNQVKQQQIVPTMRSYLKLYTTLPTQKLNDFMENKNDKLLPTQLMCYKHKTREVVRVGGDAASGELTFSSDVDFYVDKEMVHITEIKVQKRYSEFFLWNTDKLLRQAKAAHENPGNTKSTKVTVN